MHFQELSFHLKTTLLPPPPSPMLSSFLTNTSTQLLPLGWQEGFSTGPSPSPRVYEQLQGQRLGVRRKSRDQRLSLRMLLRIVHTPFHAISSAKSSRNVCSLLEQAELHPLSPGTGWANRLGKLTRLVLFSSVTL